MTKTIYNSEELLEAVKLRTFLPVSQTAFTDDDILRLATEEIIRTFTPIIRTHQEEYLVTVTDIPLQGDQTRYRMPDRAASQSIRHIVWTDGRETIRDLTRWKYEDFEWFGEYDRDEYPLHYVMEGNHIRLLPDSLNNLEGKLQVYYYVRPNKLVRTARTTEITAVTQNTISLRSINSTLDTDKFDIISGDSGCDILQSDVVGTYDGATTITTTTDIDTTRIRPGDTVTVAGESPVPNIISDLHPILVEYVALSIYKSQGDARGRNQALDEMGRIREEIGDILEDRLASDPIVLVNRNSILRRARANRWGGSVR